MTAGQLAHISIERSLLDGRTTAQRSVHPTAQRIVGQDCELRHKTALTDGKGGLTLVEAPGAAMGGTGTPKSNMEQIRYGPLIPPSKHRPAGQVGSVGARGCWDPAVAVHVSGRGAQGVLSALLHQDG